LFLARLLFKLKAGECRSVTQIITGQVVLQEWLGTLQAAAANAQDKARLATASTMTAQLAAKDAQLAAKAAQLAAMQRQLDEMTMMAKN
jgi:hypothetical protein